MDMEKRKKRMEALARSFPSLRYAPGVSPWNAELFADWAAGPAPSHGMLCAAQFVLRVWNHYDEWECGKLVV